MSLEVLIPEERLKARIEELGRRISDDYRGKTVHLVCVLKGAYTFLSDLARNIDVPVLMVSTRGRRRSLTLAELLPYAFDKRDL